jgi:transposase
LLAGQRTAALNALRGHLAEIGVVAPQGVRHVDCVRGVTLNGKFQTFSRLAEVVFHQAA